MLRLAFMGSLFLRVRFCIINSGKQTGLVVRNVRFWLVSSGFSSSLSLPPLLLWLAAGTGACSCFFDDSTMLPHPPPPPHPIPEGSSPQIVWLLFGSSFFSSAPALLASRDTEQVNRAHHTLHVSVLVMCSVLLL